MKKLILFLFLVFPITTFSYEWVMTHNSYNEIIESINCPNSENCYFLAQDDVYSRVYKSTDYGATWKLKYQSDPGNEGLPIVINATSGCSPIPNYYYYGVWEESVIKFSNNDCKTFSMIDLNLKKPINEVQMFDTLIGIAISGDEYIITKNGWRDFKKFKVPYNGDFASPIFLNKDTIIAILYSSESPGIIILDINTQNYSFSEDIDVFEILKIIKVNEKILFGAGSKKTGFAHTSFDIVIKSTDGGYTWKLIHKKEVEPNFGLMDIAFHDENVGIAVGQFGKVIITLDGGDTWEYLELSEEMKQYDPPTMTVAWAGDYPIVGTFLGRMFRLENFDYHSKPEPIIQVDKLDFGPKEIHDTTTTIKKIKIHNQSYADLQIFGFSELTESAFTNEFVWNDSMAVLTVKPLSYFELPVSFKPTEMRKYKVSIIVHSNASKQDSIVLLEGEGYDSTISVEDNLITNYQLQITPNPAGEYIEIDFKNVETGLRPVSTGITIYNVLGECVKTVPIHPMTASHRMNIEDFPTGVYFVRIGNIVKVFVKE